MTENRFSFRKDLKCSVSNSSSCNNSIDSFSSGLANIQIKNIRKKKNYFEIYNQIKEEEMKKIKNESEKANTALNPGRKELVDNSNKKGTTQINDNSKRNFKKLKGKKKNNKKENGKKKDFDNNALKETINKKKEYINFNEKMILLGKKLNMIKKVKLIQKWYRFIKNNRNLKNKTKSKLKNMNEKNINNKINDIPIYYESKQISFSFSNKYKNNSKNFDEEYNNYYKNINLGLNNKKKNNLLKSGNVLKNNNIKNKNISFQILQTNSKNNLETINTIIKPINNNCYISKGEMILLNYSQDMTNLILIQKKVKRFLRNKNQISPYKIYKQMAQKKISKKKNSKNIPNNASGKNINEILNNSEKILRKGGILSRYDSLQSIHNFTFKDNEYYRSIKFMEDNLDDSSSYINYQDNYTHSDNNIESEFNLMNFSFNSDKNKIKMKEENIKMIKKKNSDKKYFYISKNIYYDFNDLICKIKFLQNKIRKFLSKNNPYFYSENSSEITYNNYNSQKYYQNDLIIEKNHFNLQSKDKSAKEKILKILLNKYNKKLNKEVNDNINLYHNRSYQKNQIIKISKNKLAITLVKILKNKLRGIFNDIYKFESINYKREICLLKLFNNINSKLRRYFFIWSNRPLKLLIYKTKSAKYYNSLFILNNNIKKLIKSIYDTFIYRYYYILIIYYLNKNGIDVANNKIFLLLKNKHRLKMFFEISKNINHNNGKNKQNIVEYFKELENLNNSKFKYSLKVGEEEEEEEEEENSG